MSGGDEVTAAYLRRLRGWAAEAGVPAATVAAAVAADLALRDGAPASLAGEGAGLGAAPGGRPEPPRGAPAPWLVGWAYEATLAPAARKGRGVFYTPAPLARRLAELAVAAALTGADGPSAQGRRGPLTVCDPACGAGAFLLAAADVLAGSGRDPAAVVAGQLWGVDVDAEAVGVARMALRWWAWERTGELVAPDSHLCAGDAFAALPAGSAVAPSVSTPALPSGSFDVVVGNPPFLGQLQRDTARGTDERQRLRGRFGAAAGGYVDTSLLFLLLGAELVRPGGVVALLQPTSVLAAAHAAPARADLLERARLEGLWIGGLGLFDASVSVCAPLLRRRHRRTGEAADPSVRRWVGSRFEPAADAPPPRPPQRWAPLATVASGVPEVTLAAGGRLGEVAEATAGFRDQYYGLVPYVREAADVPEEAPLVTVGLVEPAWCAWGRRPARFGGRRWERPVVDVAALRHADPRLGRWVEGRLVPKVVVATQSKVLEAAVDEQGRWVPSVPTIAVTAAPGERSGELREELWRIAAVLLCPHVTAHAHTLHGGVGLSPAALRLSARQLLDLPVPADELPWKEAAGLIRAATAAASPTARREALVEAGRAMADAYRVGNVEPVLGWWRRRLPRHSNDAIP